MVGLSAAWVAQRSHALGFVALMSVRWCIAESRVLEAKKVTVYLVVPVLAVYLYNHPWFNPYLARHVRDQQGSLLEACFHALRICSLRACVCRCVCADSRRYSERSRGGCRAGARDDAGIPGARGATGEEETAGGARTGSNEAAAARAAATDVASKHLSLAFPFSHLSTTLSISPLISEWSHHIHFDWMRVQLEETERPSERGLVALDLERPRTVRAEPSSSSQSLRFFSARSTVRDREREKSIHLCDAVI